MFTDTRDIGESDNLTLPFSTSCDRCFNLGYRIHPQGGVEQCPVIQSSEPHPEISPAGKMIDRSIRLLIHRKIEVDQLHFDIARTLAAWTSEKPCTNDELVRRHFAYVQGGSEHQRRAVAKSMRFLRDIWFLPVASRKDRPAGYWICTTEAEFKEYFERAKREPITRLSTLHRLAAANWPVFAEQMEVEFWMDMSPVREFLEQTSNALEFIPEGEAIPYDVASEGIQIDP